MCWSCLTLCLGLGLSLWRGPRFDIEKETPVIFNGPNNQSDPGIEAQMDVELIEGVAQVCSKG